MERIHRFLSKTSKLVHAETKELGSWKAKKGVYDKPVSYTWTKENFSVKKGDFLVSTRETIFLNQTITKPTDWSNSELIGLHLLFGAEGKPTNHEALVSINGKPYHGIDRNRSFSPLPVSDKGQWDIQVELYNPIAQSKDMLNEQNEPAEYAPPEVYFLENALVLKNEALEKYIYLIKAYIEAIELLPAVDMDRITVGNVLNAHLKTVEHVSADQWNNQGWVSERMEALKQELASMDFSNKGKIHLVGQSHIDLAWLWPAKESVRKVSRTYSTMSTLLETDENFTYAQSQPSTFAFIKEHYPDIYTRVKGHIDSGRFELVGGMWVEPDLNIPSGESLVRQLLYGLTFYKDEFGKKPEIEWLPDTFGYCASLPQILKLAGMNYFMTTKMNWNDTNEFPYDLFYWKGIDGTSILSYLNHGVNEHTHPKEIDTHWKSFKQKDVHQEQMLLYGHGDGGGGVTKEMLAYAEHSEQLPGLPKVEFSRADAFFNGITEANPSLPTWSGDMYLELHRGTYTTHAYNKKANRFAEGLYREAEIWTAFANVSGKKVDNSTLQTGWKSLLFNQFHDIIPGTSIPEVYEQSTKDYQEIFKIGQEARETALKAIAEDVKLIREGKSYILFNSLSWKRDETIEIHGGKELANKTACKENGDVLPMTVRMVSEENCVAFIYVSDIPAMGYTTIYLEEGKSREKELTHKTFTNQWETPFYQVEWNEKGEITSLFDKQARREIVLSGQVANQLQFFHDKPLVWDAWDIDPEFEQNPAEEAELVKVEVIEQGSVQDVLGFTWKLSNSIITQHIVFSYFHKRIDFKTEVEWQEEHKLLKVAFPVDVRASHATYEIPFGAVERSVNTNTSWEKAQFEVCGHRFADLSEGDYGVSLLNDSKYGYDIKGQVLRLSLLRAPKWPDRTADMGTHEFVYSLYPHEGSWQHANTVQQGYELNQPSVVVEGEKQNSGSLPAAHSFINMEENEVIVDTIKEAENKKGLIVRLYEATGSRKNVVMKPNFHVTTVEETNLLEEVIGNVSSNEVIEATTKPYEIKTFRLRTEDGDQG
ncbi:alpha-mannosidase [Oceanobacillus picturae]|uniref:alpha-mannosidase n=1 Tax=Oceanobacillus picturae TaxID=171693 RepID=UPI0036291EA5